MKIRDLVPWGRSKTEGAKGELRPERLAPRGSSDNGSIMTLQEDINHVFDRFFERFERPLIDRHYGTLSTSAKPNVDLSETNDELKVEIDLPGMDEKDLEVSLIGDVLTIRGERGKTQKSENKGYLLHERTYGAFYRTIQLPPGFKADKVSADFKQGVLTVTVPKSENATAMTKRIEVKAA